MRHLFEVYLHGFRRDKQSWSYEHYSIIQHNHVLYTDILVLHEFLLIFANSPKIPNTQIISQNLHAYTIFKNAKQSISKS